MMKSVMYWHDEVNDDLVRCSQFDVVNDWLEWCECYGWHDDVNDELVRCANNLVGTMMSMMDWHV